MKTLYVCEKCGKTFDTLEEYNQHEVNCNIVNIFTCDKCGKTIQWKQNDPHAFALQNKCHNINLGILGYGSKLDGSNVNFNLCDDCLVSFIDTFIHKDKIYYSGVFCYYDKAQMLKR